MVFIAVLVGLIEARSKPIKMRVKLVRQSDSLQFLFTSNGEEDETGLQTDGVTLTTQCFRLAQGIVADYEGSLSVTKQQGKGIQVNVSVPASSGEPSE